eukprot:TRINITY_DN17301_c0_g1_i1.p1 TRINITY_DN17301_c0_g1~~TRINITY_DN17301_c0_g1_i1.p1  ORF type:complete len:346 (-),score=46.96 TRINITY_DN17301_c0_g1_i1:637-1674(-)
MSNPECTFSNLTPQCDGGRIYVLAKNESTWVTRNSFRFPANLINARFGWNMMANDEWLIITARSSIFRGSELAIIYAFNITGDILPVQKSSGLRSRMPSTDQDFGFSTAQDGEFIVSGSPGMPSRTNQTNAGAVFFFRPNRHGRWAKWKSPLYSPTPAAEERFGSSVAIKKAVVCVGNNPLDPNAEAVYVFDQAGTSWNLRQIIQDLTSSRFGAKLLMTPDTLLVSAPNDSSIVQDLGSIHVYALHQNGSYIYNQTLVPTNQTAGLHFGSAMDHHENQLAIGTDTCPSGVGCSVRGNDDIKYQAKPSICCNYVFRYPVGAAGVMTIPLLCFFLLFSINEANIMFG